MKRLYKVLMAKPGLDGHDRGAHIVARGLRDAGFEVILTGLFQSPEMIVRVATDEDVDVVGMSVLSGAHNVLLPRVAAGIRGSLPNALIIAGGVIPERDIPSLMEAGVRRVFRTGSSISDIASWLEGELDSLQP